MKKPTYDEFRGLVKEKFKSYMSRLSEEQVEEYLNSEESKEVIENQYEMSSQRLEQGEITEEVFRNGGASAAAHCLEMLY